MSDFPGERWEDDELGPFPRASEEERARTLKAYREAKLKYRWGSKERNAAHLENAIAHGQKPDLRKKPPKPGSVTPYPRGSAKERLEAQKVLEQRIKELSELEEALRPQLDALADAQRAVRRAHVYVDKVNGLKPPLTEKQRAEWNLDLPKRGKSSK